MDATTTAVASANAAGVPRPILRSREAIAIAIGVVVGERTGVPRRLGRRRPALDRRRAVLRGTGQHLSAGGRRLGLPAPRARPQLRPCLLAELEPGTRIVSHAFRMGDWEPEQTVEVGDSTIFLWTVPAR